MPNNTLLTDNALDALIVGGSSWLLGRDEKGTETVSRYEANELVEVFTAEQIEALAGGKVVRQQLRFGHIEWVNMIGAARFRFENA
jgi:hypothetical protein